MYRPEEYRSMSSISRPLRGDPRSLTVDGGERKRSESLPGPARTESESEPASESALLKATDTAQGDHVDLQITENRAADGDNSFLSRNTINRREH